MRDFRKQAEELVDRMTVEEMASQLKYDAPAVPRLGVPAYNWWNEALHGVARAGTATMFPQAIGLAAMFDAEMVRGIGDVIATEARAKYNAQASLGDRGIYKGLTFWSPNLNIFRDPRWGRGQETYGEDPYLTSRLGVAFIRGLQGDEWERGGYMKAAACAKHFAVHSGPEKERHSFDAVVSAKDLEETYLPAFEAAVREAGVEAVMGAYNRVNGEPCCGSATLLGEILRGRWGFEGHVVSDCWAIRDFHEHHMVTATAAESAALALKNGCDLNCGNTYLHILKALGAGLVEAGDIRRAAVRLFTTRMKLGLFADDCGFDRIPYEDNDSASHNLLSLEAARRSAVLLKNDGILPLRRDACRTIGVIGPAADRRSVLTGNYFGTASEYVTNLEGIRRIAGEDVRILYSEGSHLWDSRLQRQGEAGDRLSEAVTVARHSDVVILCLGLDASLEGEQMEAGNGFDSGDKPDLLLPECQRNLLEAVCGAGKPVVLVLNTGSAVDVSAAGDRCGAILQCWYSGSHGGTALAEILFGEVNPSGKLPVTFYYDGTLPDFRDYGMKGRTYRYLEGEPLYPFGYGLSYSRFRFDELKAGRAAADPPRPEAEGKCPAGRPDTENGGGRPALSGSVRVTNESARDGDAVVQVYLDRQPYEKAANGKNTRYSAVFSPDNQPGPGLCWFGRVTVPAGKSVTVPFRIAVREMESVMEDGSRAALAGRYTLYAGGSQPDARSRELLGEEDWDSLEFDWTV